MLREYKRPKLNENIQQENVLWLEIPKEYSHMPPKEYYMMRFRNTLRRSTETKQT